MIDTLIYIGLILLALNLLVAVHELGHLATAIGFGVKVETIAIGFGPKLISRQIKQIEWQVNLVPAGGYVKLSDESYDKAPSASRFCIVAAGVTVNFAMASALIFTYELLLPNYIIVEKTVVREVVPGSAAERAGLMPGDQIVQAKIGAIITELSNSKQLPFLMKQTAGENIEALVRRGEREFNATLSPQTGENSYGLTVGASQKQVYRTNRKITEAAKKAIEFNPQMTVSTYHVIEQSIKEKEPIGLVGIIGITKMGKDAIEASDWKIAIVLLATLSYCVGLMNLAPIPPLDGGKLALLSIENAFGFKISPKAVAVTNMLAIAALLFLVFLLAISDIRRLAW